MYFKKISIYKEYEVWKFIPDLFHAFPFYMEDMTLSHRIRCIFEFFYGYRIYYFKLNDDWVGYCVISSGSNKRYKFSNVEDIIFGRYFIDDKYRGRNISLVLLKYVLNIAETDYKNAYAYVNINNIASNKIMNKLGAIEVDRFYLRGLFRRLFFNTSGDYILYKYCKDSVNIS